MGWFEFINSNSWFFFTHLLSQHLFGTVCLYFPDSFFAYCVEMLQFETQNERVFLNAPPWVWISSHLVDKCSVIRSTICRDGPCDGDSDKCCCGDHLLSEGYRNTEESQSVLRNLLCISFSNFILIEASLSLGLTHGHRIAEWESMSLENLTILTTTSVDILFEISWAVVEYDCFI